MYKKEIKELLYELNISYDDFIKWTNNKEENYYDINEVHAFVAMKTSGLNLYWN